MNNKLNNAMNEIDEALIEEAVHADRAEHNGLKIARNIGLSLCGAAAAAAALTFGINHHLASLPENVDLLPANSNEANSGISEVILERSALQTLPVERVDAADADTARLSACEPYFIDAGNQWKTFDDDGNMLSEGNTVVLMDCGGYWLYYDITADDGVIDEMLDIRGALKQAENVLGASLLPDGLRMGYYSTLTVTASFDDGSCLNYSLSCDPDHEQWTMKLLSDDADYLSGLSSRASFFREERAGVYDSARFNDRSGAYICDNNGEIRVVKYTSEGCFGYLPFGGREYIYTLENTETGSRQKYCVKESGDAITTTEDFLTVSGTVEHQNDPTNIEIPSSLRIVDGMGSEPFPSIGASKMYHLSFAPDYDGLALTFMVDSDGKVFLYDFAWLYPCDVTKSDNSLYSYEVSVNFFPEGRETPDGTYPGEVVLCILADGDELTDSQTWTFAEEALLFIDEQGSPKEITLLKGTEFTLYENTASQPIRTTGDVLDSLGEKIRAAQSGAVVFPAYQAELIPPVDSEFNSTVIHGDSVYTITHSMFEGENIGGADISAAQSGKVIITDFDEDYGNYAVIDHGSGLATVYAHCADITVTEGQCVSQGDVIGHVGATGRAASDGLLFEVRVDGAAVDPMEYLNFSEAQTTDATEEESPFSTEKQRELNEHWAELIASVPDPNFLYPVGGDYAITEHMYGHSPDSGYVAHSGIDIGVGVIGEPILAAADGEVILSQWYNGYGKCVMIRHDNGVVTVYGHCDELYVSRGDAVTRGQTIATIGITGQTTTAHLHFEVMINNECVDPALFEYQILINGELTERTTFA